MKKESKTILFFGSGPVATESLVFIAKHFGVEAVITKAVPAHHKGIAPVEELAKKLNLPILFANNKSELDNIVEKNNFKSNIGIIVDYGVIVSQKVIDTFELGIVNSHFSLLPQWRGADPITFSILSGQPKTGVSLMVIEPSLDTGKLITYKSLAIEPVDTTQTLTKKLIDLSNQLMIRYLPRYISGEIKPKNQPHPNRATYSRKIIKNDGIIDFSKPADQIEREIRAYLGWPGSKTEINGHRITVTKAHVVDLPEDPLDLKCQDGKYISIDELVAPSGRRMAARDFINGYL